jgi:4-amino-4-deoxy-L-arabinose transferase-like glycosyltransferase
MDAVAKGRTWDAAWVLACALASSVWCVSAAAKLGATADETPYLKMGLERWRTGSYQGFMSVGTMPLAADVQTLPLYLRERARGAPFDVEPDLPKLLPWARAATLLFWWVLLAHGFLIGRRLAGPWGGRWAVALLTFEPTLLAHAGLATTDVAVSALALALVYHFHRGRERGWGLRVGVPAACFGALLLAKASAVMFGPVCLAVVGLAWAAARPVPRPLRALAFDLPQVLVLGTALAALYVGSEWRASAFLPPRVEKLAPGPFRAALEAYQALPLFPNLSEGILFQVFQNGRGTSAYLFGEVHVGGVWYYFPVALTMKLPVPLLVLPLLIALVRPRALLNWAVLAALALLLLSVTYRVQNGVRIVLPLVALWAVGLGAALARAADEGSAARRRALGTIAAVAVAWVIASGATARPDGLAYFNEFWRARPGYLYLNDSNYDWGQGLKRLDRWHERHGRPPLLVWTHGNDPAFRTMPVRQYQLDSLRLSEPDEHLEKVRGHYVAASALQVYGYWDTPAVRFLRARTPVAQAGTYLIYDFTAPK